MRCARGCVCAATLVLVLAAAPPSAAHDRAAPAGAIHQWLPAEAWVMRHWVPFDQRRLERALGLRGDLLESYLFDDHHTLALLVRRRGSSARELADHLMEPWRGVAPPERLALLRRRTLAILTQGHLAQHILFHVFHSLGSHDSAHDVFGTSARRFQVLRNRGETPIAIARRHGVTRGRLAEGVHRLLQHHHDDGIARGEAWPRQSARILARQKATLGCWMRSQAPWRDRGNPYGKARWQHGRHARDWPSTARERRINERRVERVRRRLEWTCWPRVREWDWPAALRRTGTLVGADPA